MIKKSVLARNIRKIRAFKNLSQTEFAEQLGINRPALAAYEEGRSEPKLATLLKLSRISKLTLDQLVTGELTVNQVAGFDLDSIKSGVPDMQKELQSVMETLREIKIELKELKKNMPRKKLTKD